MTYTFTQSRIARLAAVLGLTTLFAGIAAVTPAQAQDDYRIHQDRAPIRREVYDIHRDQDRLHDLYRRRDYLRGRRDWRGVAALDVQIGDFRFHIENDRSEVRRDFDRARFDRDRDFRRTYDSDRDFRRDHDDTRDHYRSQDHDYRRDRSQDDYRLRDGH